MPKGIIAYGCDLLLSKGPIPSPCMPLPPCMAEQQPAKCCETLPSIHELGAAHTRTGTLQAVHGWHVGHAMSAWGAVHAACSSM
jgi:hypothetical protein